MTGRKALRTRVCRSSFARVGQVLLGLGGGGGGGVLPPPAARGCGICVRVLVGGGAVLQEMVHRHSFSLGLCLSGRLVFSGPGRSDSLEGEVACVLVPGWCSLVLVGGGGGAAVLKEMVHRHSHRAYVFVPGGWSW